jgi:hypothetical protein
MLRLVTSSPMRRSKRSWSTAHGEVHILDVPDPDPPFDRPCQSQSRPLWGKWVGGAIRPTPTNSISKISILGVSDVGSFPKSKFWSLTTNFPKIRLGGKKPLRSSPRTPPTGLRSSPPLTPRLPHSRPPRLRCRPPRNLAKSVTVE